tara:strand:- start:96 stop:1421 length:1326 start_codon:yes stop_codon:yes gene_type:complete
MKELHRQTCTWHEPDIIAQELIKRWGKDGLIWLDGDNTKLGRWVTLAANPIDQICCRGLPQEINSSNPFEALRKLNQGHWTGWISYEAGAWTEPQNPWQSNEMATLWIASHDPVFKFDLKNKELWVEGYNQTAIRDIVFWIQRLGKQDENERNQSYRNTKIPLSAWKWQQSATDYSKKVSLIKDLISQGDIFQANLTTGCTTNLENEVCPVRLYEKLRKCCPAPFGGIVIGAGSAHNEAIISASPERFLKVLPNGDIETRPIKGTRPRHLDPKEDANKAIELVTSTKDRAENIMIVDLLRNDLGRVCRPGSIYISQLVGLESFEHVHHLTSVIKGSLSSNKSWVDLLEACWPGGSITGAPKLRACQRLYELENTARGPYCGSFLKIDWDGTFDSNILIRSLIMKDLKLRANAGGGIIADSDPNEETKEMNWKLLPLLKALT